LLAQHGFLSVQQALGLLSQHAFFAAQHASLLAQHFFTSSAAGAADTNAIEANADKTRVNSFAFIA
jgi:hypothetical protein